MEKSIERIAVQPIIRQTNTQFDPVRKAILIKCPKDLYMLYHEYEFGYGGNKPAKEFSRNERGTCRYTYSLRKIFWDKIDDMIRRGYTSDSAIDHIYQKLGKKHSVSKILRLMRYHRKNGSLVDL